MLVVSTSLPHTLPDPVLLLQIAPSSPFTMTLLILLERRPNRILAGALTVMIERDILCFLSISRQTSRHDGPRHPTPRPPPRPTPHTAHPTSLPLTVKLTGCTVRRYGGSASDIQTKSDLLLVRFSKYALRQRRGLLGCGSVWP